MTIHAALLSRSSGSLADLFFRHFLAVPPLEMQPPSASSQFSALALSLPKIALRKRLLRDAGFARGCAPHASRRPDLGHFGGSRCALRSLHRAVSRGSLSCRIGSALSARGRRGAGHSAG